MKTKKKKPSSKVTPKAQPKSKASAKSKKVTRPRKVGIFGGTFNPFHLGHLNSLLAVEKQFGLKSIRIIPSNETPGKPTVEVPSAEQRLEMATLAVQDYKKNLVADGREVERGGISYTIDTIQDLKTEDPTAEYYLIIGADLVASFHTWKSFEKILKLVHVIVTSRPGNLLPFKKDDLPSELQPFVKEINRERVILTTGKTIQYIQLEDKEISGTEIRKCVRSGLRVDRYLSMAVEKYIRKNEFYRPSVSNQLDFKQITQFVSTVLFDKKGFNVKGFDLTKCQAPSEYAIVASGTSTRHVGGLGESVIYEVKKKFGLNPLSAEGIREGRWALLDFGGLIVHVFYDFVRNEYKLEELWKEKIDMHLKDTSAPASFSFHT